MSLELGVSVVGLICIPFVIWYLHFQLAKSDRFSTRVEKDADDKAALNDSVHIELRRYCERLNQEIYTMRLDMANGFASNASVREMEQRFIKTVERIDLKLDRMSDEIFRRKD